MNGNTESLVSTIIPVFNRAGMLQQAVESVLSQTWRPIEIIICDDGSTDSTPDVARSYAERFPELVRYVRQENRGAGPARESGRALARGEFVQYLDSDDLLEPRKLEQQVGALRQNPAADVAYGITRLIDTDGHVLAQPFKLTGRAMDSLFPRLLVDRWWCTHTPLYRAELLDRIGPWGSLRYSQDWEYDARVGALGARLVWVPELVSSHRQHSGVRQTGSGRWLTAGEQVTFFRSLYAHSLAAGVARTSPEMRHFARWVFSQARRAALGGEATEARQLCTLATDANAAALDVRAFAAACTLFGWGPVARWVERGRHLVPREVGRDSLKQSWMR